MMTPENKTAFEKWLQEEIVSDKALILQMETLKGMEPFIKQRKLELAAAMVILRKLQGMESYSIGG